MTLNILCAKRRERAAEFCARTARVDCSILHRLRVCAEAVATHYKPYYECDSSYSIQWAIPARYTFKPFPRPMIVAACAA